MVKLRDHPAGDILTRAPHTEDGAFERGQAARFESALPQSPRREEQIEVGPLLRGQVLTVHSVA